MSGLILVFDLDQTLIDSTALFPKLAEEDKKPEADRDYFSIIDSTSNKTILNDVLLPAVKLKGAGVDGIFLLTNNNSIQYVSRIIIYLNMLAQNYVFNFSMLRKHVSRPSVLNPPKRLEDVQYMMANSSVPVPFTDTGNLAKRTFMFDDNSSHVIKDELLREGVEDHYIEVQGPDLTPDGTNMGYISGKPDLTDYRPILLELAKLQPTVGGSRTRHRNRYHKRTYKRRRISKRKN